MRTHACMYPFLTTPAAGVSYTVYIHVSKQASEQRARQAIGGVRNNRGGIPSRPPNDHNKQKEKKTELGDARIISTQADAASLITDTNRIETNKRRGEEEERADRRSKHQSQTNGRASTNSPSHY